jgi:hypothetical protein
VFGPELRTWIVGADEHLAVALVRRLLEAEANRLNLPPATIRMTGNVKARDRGVDGRTDVPIGALSNVPQGEQTWQIKATVKKPDLDIELRKEGVVEDLKAGRDYVLVWTRDPPLSRAALEKELRSAVQRVAKDRTGVLFGTEDLERLAILHPAVIEAAGGPSLLGLPLARWAEHLKPGDLPFVSDEERDRLLNAIRDFCAATSKSTTHLHVYGDTGVGKSRLVLEALSVDPFSNMVFACPRADRVKTQALEAIVTSEAVAVLVVDDVSQSDAQNLAVYAAGAEGRLKLITIGERPRRDSVAGQATLDVQPLARGVIASLVSSVAGLTDEQAALIASLAEGYPRLAIELANELAGAEDVGSVVQLLKTANVGGLLERMIPEKATRKYIAHLAVVDRLGFDEELAFETTQLCEVFGLDKIGFIAAVETELGRFVSDAGRYRLATPLALAMWLVRDLIQQEPSAFADKVVGLPEQLFDAFRRQIEVLGDDRLVAELLKEVMTRKGGSFRIATDVTADFARLLRAIAFAVPELAASRIRELVVGDEVENLRQFSGDQRREFVWALAHLLWFRTTFEASADALVRLALSENENYGNNSTGTIIGAFGVHLGGTEVPLSERLSWLARTHQAFGEPGASLAVRCAGNALETMESRTGGWNGTRLQPKEWRPASPEEEQGARLEAITLIVQIASSAPGVATQAAGEIGRHFRGLVSRGMAEQTILAISGIAWTAPARAEIATGLRYCLHYDTGLLPPVRDLIERTLTALEGGSLEDKIEVALTTSYWELAVGTEERLEGPVVLEELAEAVSTGERSDLVLRFALPDSRFDEMTVYGLYEQLGRLATPAGEEIVGDHATSLASRTGYVIGRIRRGDVGWASSTVSSWTSDESLAKGVAMVVHRMEASRETLELAIEPVLAGFAPLSTLNELMLGAWIKPLSPDELDHLLSIYAGRELGHRDVDAALHMLLFWLDDDENTPTTSLLATAEALIIKTASLPDSSGGLPYVRSRLLKQLPFSNEQRLQLLLAAMQQTAFPSEEELDILEDLASTIPDKVVPAVVQILLGDELGFSLYLERANLLSRLEKAAGFKVVIEAVRTIEPDLQERLLRHLDFLGDQPDPVFLALLDSREDETFMRAAASRYLYPSQVVVGSYASYLERRLETLRQWEKSSNSARFQAWISMLVPVLESEADTERQHEAEERYTD